MVQLWRGGIPVRQNGTITHFGCGLSDFLLGDGGDQAIAEKREIFKDSVELTFDPGKSSPEIQKIFADDLARTLWLAIGQGHLKSQYFDSLILSNSEIIRKEKNQGKLNADLLLRILSGVSRRPDFGLISPREVEFAEALLPFVMEEKTISYVIKK